MNLTAIILLKEKIAVSSDFSERERNFILESINIAIGIVRSRLSDEEHAAGRTKAGNDIGGL